MRSLMCLLFVIFCSVQMTSSSPLALDGVKSNYCGVFSNVKKIPVKKVTSYYKTSSSCPRIAVVFKKIAGKELCVDPETPWVKSHVETVDKRTTV